MPRIWTEFKGAGKNSCALQASDAIKGAARPCLFQKVRELCNYPSTRTNLPTSLGFLNLGIWSLEFGSWYLVFLLHCVLCLERIQSIIQTEGVFIKVLDKLFNFL